MVKFMKVTRLFPLVRGAVSGRFPRVEGGAGRGREWRGGLGRPSVARLSTLGCRFTGSY